MNRAGLLSQDTGVPERAAQAGTAPFTLCRRCDEKPACVYEEVVQSSWTVPFWLTFFLLEMPERDELSDVDTEGSLLMVIYEVSKCTKWTLESLPSSTQSSIS